MFPTSSKVTISDEKMPIISFLFLQTLKTLNCNWYKIQRPKCAFYRPVPQKSRPIFPSKSGPSLRLCIHVTCLCVAIQLVCICAYKFRPKHNMTIIILIASFHLFIQSFISNIYMAPQKESCSEALLLHKNQNSQDISCLQQAKVYRDISKGLKSRRRGTHTHKIHNKWFYNTILGSYEKYYILNELTTCTVQLERIWTKRPIIHA